MTSKSEVIPLHSITPELLELFSLPRIERITETIS
jgi:hypothetical protein